MASDSRSFRRRRRKGLSAAALARRAGRRCGDRARRRRSGCSDACAFIHVLAVKVPGMDDDLLPGALTRESAAREEGLLFGLDSLGAASWTPPDPPPGHGPHRYVFEVFAIDQRPELEAALTAANPRRSARSRAGQGLRQRHRRARCLTYVRSASEPDAAPTALRPMLESGTGSPLFSKGARQIRTMPCLDSVRI